MPRMNQLQGLLGKAAGFRGAGMNAAKAWGTRAMTRADPYVMRAGRLGGTQGMGDDAIRRRGQFRVGVGAGIVGASSAVSGMRAKSSGGYTGANTV